VKCRLDKAIESDTVCIQNLKGAYDLCYAFEFICLAKRGENVLNVRVVN